MSGRVDPHVAVLGAGIMGASTALFLARAGCNVTLFDRARSPMDGASRWNEGKIHLGFLYAADPSLNSARRMIPGGLTFKPLIEELIGTSIEPAITTEDDLYLLHPESVVDADAVERYFAHVRHLIDKIPQNGSYLAPIGPVERLSDAAAEDLSGGSIRVGFRVPERSVRTNWVADRLVEALEAEPRISVISDTTVAGVEAFEGSWNGPWTVRSDPMVGGRFDAVVNALWQGRLAVDLASGLPVERGWSHRFRASLFVETNEVVDLPSVVLATGPFGDLKNYAGRYFYLSWYHAGLLAEGVDVEPPTIVWPSHDALVAAVKQGLIRFLPRIGRIFDNAKEVTIGGGWVFAVGQGSLADSTSSLHRRDRFGVSRVGTYVSIDTGKYSTAPLLARRTADVIRQLS